MEAGEEGRNSCFISYGKAFDCVDHSGSSDLDHWSSDRSGSLWITVFTNCGKFFKRWEYQTTWPASSAICMQVRKQQLEPDMEQQTGSKSGKEYVKAVYCQPAYLTYMQNT